jgi:glucose-1-phosphate thymidylyltransferase
MDVVGFMPAAGRAVRLGHLPCSKEILPIGVRTSRSGERRICVLGEFLLDEFARAGIEHVYVIVDPAKSDIVEYFGNGERLGLRLDYVSVKSPSTLFSIDAAYPFACGGVCALGFPDILFPPCNPYSRMIATLEQTGADIVLGLFPTEHTSMMDMVRCDRSGRVESILVKPTAARPGYEKAWVNAVWRPRFGEFLHDNLERLARRANKSRELYIGDVVMAALGEGMVAYGTAVSDSACLDAGTPETYALALTRFDFLTTPSKPGEPKSNSQSDRRR